MISYELIRSKRKTISIRITKKAQVEVRAPLGLSAKRIDEIIAPKLPWIEENLAKTQISLADKQSFALNYGDYILFRGEPVKVAKSRDGINGFFEGSIFLPDKLAPEELRLAALKAYKKAAKIVFSERVEFYSRLVGASPASVKINSAKTRWGSCSGKNSINFSWRLIMAPDDVIDYVVVHELAHTIHHNHSPSFWQLVKSVMPDYAEKRSGLKQLQQRLEHENWD